MRAVVLALEPARAGELAVDDDRPGTGDHGRGRPHDRHRAGIGSRRTGPRRCDGHGRCESAAARSGADAACVADRRAAARPARQLDSIRGIRLLRSPARAQRILDARRGRAGQAADRGGRASRGCRRSPSPTTATRSPRSSSTRRRPRPASSRSSASRRTSPPARTAPTRRACDGAGPSRSTTTSRARAPTRT